MSASKRNRAKCAAMAKLEFEPVDEITFDPLSDERWREKVKWLREGLGFAVLTLRMSKVEMVEAFRQDVAGRAADVKVLLEVEKDFTAFAWVVKAAYARQLIAAAAVGAEMDARS